jgi:hypothetical protein
MTARRRLSEGVLGKTERYYAQVTFGGAAAASVD